jgi:nucleoside-diphosphate-sugar epimerase
MKYALVLGGGGFIGSHMVKRLKREGFWVRAVDLKYPEFSASHAEEFVKGDLRDPKLVTDVMEDRTWDEVYQFAADMGGAGFVFTGENDADIMHNSALVNMNVAYEATRKNNVRRLFYSSSACMYPEHNQLDPNNPNCAEDSAYPANPDSEYGWEKLFSERLFLAFMRNHSLNVRVARYHNIFGPEGTWTGGREKAPAAMCRKAAMISEGSIEVWGSGQQTRSFLYIDECIEATIRFMRGDFVGPVNIGSNEMISINNFAKMAIQISGKDLSINNIDGQEFIEKYGHKCPIGVNGRNSDNTLYEQEVGWVVSQPLITGMKKTYEWIEKQIKN